MSERTPKTPRDAPERLDLKDGPTKYVDRPANEGKHGDAEEEPNAGVPRSDQDAENAPRPSR